MCSNARLKVILSHISQNNAVELRNTAAGRFQYTRDNPIFTNEMREFYEKNGFIVFPKLIEDEVLDACRQHFVDICDGRASKAGMTLMRDVSLAKTNAKGEFLYNKIQEILYDDVFSTYTTHKRILDIVECFTGPNIKAVHSMLINKPPDSGKETSQHPLHQDLYYFPFRPENSIVAAWTAMEPITADNGCLFVLPGTHKGQLQPHNYPDAQVNLLYHGIRGYDHHPKVNLLMEKGDTVFFHPLLIHGSGVNITKGFRKAISCHYAAAESHYIDVRGTIQESIADEVIEVAKKRGLQDLSYADVWRYRSMLVRGQDKTM